MFIVMTENITVILIWYFYLSGIFLYTVTWNYFYIKINIPNCLNVAVSKIISMVVENYYSGKELGAKKIGKVI